MPSFKLLSLSHLRCCRCRGPCTLPAGCATLNRGEILLSFARRPAADSFPPNGRISCPDFPRRLLPLTLSVFRTPPLLAGLADREIRVRWSRAGRRGFSKQKCMPPFQIWLSGNRNHLPKSFEKQKKLFSTVEVGHRGCGLQGRPTRACGWVWSFGDSVEGRSC